MSHHTYDSMSLDSQGLVPWKKEQLRNQVPPSDFTVTQIRHTHDMLRENNNNTAIAAENQNSKEWLRTHSIDALKINIKDLIDKGRIGKPRPNILSGKPTQHLTFDAMDIVEFEYRLNMAIEMYTKRMKWCLTGSRRIFGLIQGKRVAIACDASNANCGFGRLHSYQDSLHHLVDEQLQHKESLYFVQFGTNVDALWKQLMSVNCRTIDEAHTFISDINSSGGCNLLAAMKHILRLSHIDEVVIVLGSVPDQSADVIVDYVEQLCVGKNIHIHTVAYDCNNHLTNSTLRKIADVTNGLYQCYSSVNEEQIYNSFDIKDLLKEIENAQVRNF